MDAGFFRSQLSFKLLFACLLVLLWLRIGLLQVEQIGPLKHGKPSCVWRIVDAGLPNVVHKLSHDLRLRNQPSADGTKSVNARGVAGAFKVSLFSLPLQNYALRNDPLRQNPFLRRPIAPSCCLAVISATFRLL